MSKYVIKFKRGDRVKYISHLDFVRMFHRSVRRSGLDFEFSQGFNPHPIMTVAVPLSVGVTADGEYMSVGFNTELSEKEIKETLNNSLPDGFSVSEVRLLNTKKYDFNLIDYAEYIIDAECENPDALDIESLLSGGITVMKKSKSGEKETDIRPLIHSIKKVDAGDGNLGLSMIIRAGNRATLKPETVISAINIYQPSVNIGFFSSHRKSLLNEKLKELF